MDKFSGRPGDNKYEALVDDFEEATTGCDSDNKQRVHGSPSSCQGYKAEGNEEGRQVILG